jgi:hypothetical protein
MLNSQAILFPSINPVPMPDMIVIVQFSPSQGVQG